MCLSLLLSLLLCVSGFYLIHHPSYCLCGCNYSFLPHILHYLIHFFKSFLLEQFYQHHLYLSLVALFVSVLRGLLLKRWVPFSFRNFGWLLVHGKLTLIRRKRALVQGYLLLLIVGGERSMTGRFKNGSGILFGSHLLSLHQLDPLNDLFRTIAHFQHLLCHF